MDIIMKKNVTMEYNLDIWKKYVGEKVIPLVSYSVQLEEQFARIQCLRFDEFKNAI